MLFYSRASSSSLHLFPRFFTVSITRPINRWKGNTGARRQRGSVRARRALGPLMFPGGSIVGKRRHDRNVIMSVLKLLSLTDEPSRGTVKKWAKPRSRVSHINRRFTCTRAFYLFFLSLSSLEKDRYLSIDKIII